MVGQLIVQWLWGGFSVDNATLTRFFSLHYLWPFVIVGLSILHIACLHQYGSNNPLGVYSGVDKIPFGNYYEWKDEQSCGSFMLCVSTFLFYDPKCLGHHDNSWMCNPNITPAHIQPEWYFLVFYAILRSAPNKSGGCILMGLSFLLAILCHVLSAWSMKRLDHKPAWTFFLTNPKWPKLYWLFLADCILLGRLGAQPPSSMESLCGLVLTAHFFLFGQCLY